MRKQFRQASAYLDDETYQAITKVARENRRSLSAYLKQLIEQNIADTDRQDTIIAMSKAILIGVDALVKHHPNEKLFGVVKATRETKLGGSRHEA